MAYRITEIRLSSRGNTVEHITDVRGYNDSNNQEFTLTVSEVIWYLKAGYSFYVKVDNNKAVVTYAKSIHGHEYIRTEPDATKKDNLLSLPIF